MTTKSLIFHAGPHKTGSTSLQEFLRLNKKLFADQGIDYIREHSLRNVWATDHPTDFLSTWQTVIDQFKASSNSLVITDETFAEIFAKNPKSIRDLKSHFPDTPIRILIYLRRQDLHYESFYKALVTGYGHTDLPNVAHVLDSPGYTVIPSKDRFHHDPLILHDYDYYGWLMRLAKEIGKENLIVRIFERDKFVGGDLYKDFVDALGLEWSDKLIVPKRISAKGLNSKAVPLCRQYNATFPNGLEQKIFSYFLVYVGEIIGIDDDKRILSDDERKKILDRFQEGNQLLSNEFFDSTPLFSEKGEKDGLASRDISKLDNEDMESMLLYLHHFWFELIANADPSLLNYIRLHKAQRERKQGVPGARLRHFIYKTIHSIGKRISKSWRGDTGEIAVAFSNVFSYVDMEDLKKRHKERKG